MQEEKLRAIFTDDLEPVPVDKTNLKITLRKVLNDLTQIRYLSEVETWKYIPEVAQLLFERIVSTSQYHDDEGKLGNIV